MGGHYDRRHKVQDSDIWVECCCSECRDDPTPGLPGKRILCRKFEAHGGKETAKKYYESIKTVDKDGNRRKLIKWIQGKCKEIGNQMVGHKIRVWWPADNNGIGVYHTGTVASFDDQWADHHINYDDDDGEDLWLAVESWTDLGLDPQWVQPQVPSVGLVSQSVNASAEKSSSRVYKQNSQSDVSQSQGLQQSPSGSASDPDYSAEQLSRKQSHSSRGLPSKSDPGKKRRRPNEHAQDLSKHLPDGKAQPHGAPESDKSVPVQAKSAVEVSGNPHSHKQQLQTDKQAGQPAPGLGRSDDDFAALPASSQQPAAAAGTAAAGSSSLAWSKMQESALHEYVTAASEQHWGRDDNPKLWEDVAANPVLWGRNKVTPAELKEVYFRTKPMYSQPEGEGQPKNRPRKARPLSANADTIRPSSTLGLPCPDLAPGTTNTPAERTIHDWKEVFSEANVETVSSPNMLKSITEMLKTLSNQRFGPALLGRLSSLPAEEKARSIKGLFQGCSELFAFVEDDLAQMKELFLEYFETAHLTRQAVTELRKIQ